MGREAVRFCDLRRVLFGGYNREDVLRCYQLLMRRHQAEEEQFRHTLEAKETIIRELSSENEALQVKNKRLEEQAERHEKIKQRL